MFRTVLVRRAAACRLEHLVKVAQIHESAALRHLSDGLAAEPQQFLRLGNADILESLHHRAAALFFIIMTKGVLAHVYRVRHVVEGYLPRVIYVISW